MITGKAKHMMQQVAGIRSPAVIAAINGELLRLGLLPDARQISARERLNEQVTRLEAMGEFSLATSIQFFLACNAWVKYGCQIFRLSEEVTDLLACTKPPSLDELSNGGDLDSIEGMEGWRIPYPSFAVDLPFPVGVEEEPWLYRVGGTMAPPPSEDTGRRMFSFAIVVPYRNRDTNSMDWEVCYQSAQDVAVGAVTVSHGTTAISGLLTNLCGFLAGHKKSKDRSKNYSRTIEKRLRTPISAWNVDLKGGTPLDVGCSAEFLREGRQPPRRFKVGKQFIVRGHWRNQASGPGRSSRKLIWIRPHLKGPDDAEAWSSVKEIRTA